MRKETKGVIFISLLMLIDEISTYIAIPIINIAQENNKTLISMWNRFGYLGGSLLKLFILDFGLIVFTGLFLYSKHKKLKLIGWIILIVFMIDWVLTDLSNIIIILSRI